MVVAMTCTRCNHSWWVDEHEIEGECSECGTVISNETWTITSTDLEEDGEL